MTKGDRILLIRELFSLIHLCKLKKKIYIYLISLTLPCMWCSQGSHFEP